MKKHHRRRRYNSFAEGGESSTSAVKGQGMSGVLSAAGGVTDILSDVTDNLSTPDARVTPISASSKNELYNQIYNFQGYHLGRNNALTSGINSGLAGAQTGLAVGGPWGAAAGAVVGLASGVGSALAGNAKNRRKERRLNDAQFDYFMGSNNLINQHQITADLSNYSALGGNLNVNGGYYSNGLTSFDNGGLHESNPIGGILQGFDEEGTPNLVEEGETKYNNYIFSNRLKPSKDILAELDLPARYSKKSYADISKEVARESSERPNDPISKRGLDASIERLRIGQEATKLLKAEDNLQSLNNDMNEYIEPMDNEMKKGGGIYIKPSKRGTFTAAAKKRGMGVQQFASKVLANKDRYSKAMVRKAQFAKNSTKFKHAFGGELYTNGGDISHYNTAVLRSKYPYTGGYIEYSGIYADGGLPRIETPMINFDEQSARYNNELNRLRAGRYVNDFDWNALAQQPVDIDINAGRDSRYTGMLGMLAPAAANIGFALQDSFDRPEVVSYPRINTSGRGIDQRMPYKPVDREYIANKIRSSASANRRAIVDSSGGNRNTALAGLAIADYTANTALGDAYLRGDEANYNRLLQSKQFNRQTDMANLENSMRSQQLNSGIAMQEMNQNALNRAARRTAVRNALATVADNIGAASKYDWDVNRINNMFPLYDEEGNYIGSNSTNRRNRRKSKRR